MQNHPLTIHKFPVTWFLVADGRTAQTYTYSQLERRAPCNGNSKHHHYSESREKVLVPVTGMKLEAESDADYETGEDRLGRVFESRGAARYMSEPHVDIHEKIKGNFMKAIAAKLSMAKTRKAFDRLVLVAPAKMLGEVKKHLTSDVLEAVVAELPKDYTKCDEDALSQYLQQIQ